MQVNNSGSAIKQVHSSQEGQKPQQASAQPLPNSATGSNDTVNISNAATQLNRVEQQINGAKISNPQHIEQLQSALKTGGYSPDPQQVAGKLLNFEAALNNVRH